MDCGAWWTEEGIHTERQLGVGIQSLKVGEECTCKGNDPVWESKSERDGEGGLESGYRNPTG